jgi:branched-chain amino acid transport system substrate-binding protein
MKSKLLGPATIAALAFSLQPVLAQSSIKIGFVSTFSGPQAAIGEDMRRSVELALEHLGGKMGGKKIEVVYEDDQFKPDVGKARSEKLVQQDKVNFVAGYIWSNVLLASLKTVTDEGDTILISSNAGPSQIAGELCNKNFFSTSWNNDQTPMAMGEYLNSKGVKSLYVVGPNYAAGKDMLEGVSATFKGEVIGRELTRWPDQLDFAAELSKARAARPDAIFAFYPGGPGIQFLTQYAQSGLKGQTPLYTAFTIDALSLPRLKHLALGIPGAQQWVRDLPNEANTWFVEDYRARYKSDPAFYGAQTYDAMPLLDGIVRAVNGDLSKKDEMRRAAEKADFKSVRGKFKFGPNHIPIQNFYLQEAVKDGDEYRLKTVATIVENDQDKHWQKCKMPN